MPWEFPILKRVQNIRGQGRSYDRGDTNLPTRTRSFDRGDANLRTRTRSFGRYGDGYTLRY